MGPDFSLNAKSKSRLRDPRDISDRERLLRIDLRPNEAGDEDVIEGLLVARHCAGLHGGPHDRA